MKRRTPETAYSSTPIRVALYARVSTDRQAKKEEGSLDTQLARLHHHLESRPGEHEIVGEFREEGVSGGSMDRPQFQRLLARIRHGDVDLVVVTSVDRFSRSLRDFLDLQVEFQTLGVELVSLKETFDTSSAMGRAMVRMLLVFAELERETTSERTKAALLGRVQRGLWSGGKPPLGYRRSPDQAGHIEVVPEHADLVRLIFAKFLEFKSAPRAAKWLDENGYRQPLSQEKKGARRKRVGKSDPTQFKPSTVRDIVTCRSYLGEVPLKGDWYTGLHEPIIEENTFEKAQNIIGRNQVRRHLEAPNRNYDYLLQGIVFDPNGHAMTPSRSTSSSGRPYFYYHCSAQQKQTNYKPPVRRVAAPELEAEVRGVVRVLAQKPQILDRAVADANEAAAARVDPLTDQLAAAQSQLSEVQAETDELLDKILRLDLGSSKAAKRRLATLESRCEKLTQQVNELDAEVAFKREQRIDPEVLRAVLVQFDRVWDNLTVGERKLLLEKLFARIEVRPSGLVLDLYDGRAAQVAVEWGHSRRRRDGKAHRGSSPAACKPVGRVCFPGEVGLPKEASSGRIETCFVIDLDEARKRLRGGHIPPRRPPKILATLDLAESWQARLERGDVNRAGLAREYLVSRARVTQVLKLLNLHPAILRWVREHPRSGSEYRLRPLLDLSGRAQLREAERVLAGFKNRQTG